MSQKREASFSEEEPVRKLPKIDDDRSFVMYYSPVPAKDLAGFKIALSIWYHHRICFSKTHGYGNLHYNTRSPGPKKSYIYVPSYVSSRDYYNDKNPLMRPIKRTVEELNLPRPIENIVVHHCKCIESELRYWSYYHKDLIPLELVDITDILWKSDRHIDYLATVRRLLSSSRFKLEPKFNLVSTYCLEKELIALPEEIVNNKFMEKIKDYEILRFYWKCYLRGALGRVDTRGLPLDRFMLVHAASNQSSIEYFFNRLNKTDPEAAAAVSASLISWENFKFRTLVLSKLNKSQHHEVLKKCIESVIIDLGRFISYENYISAVWINYKEFVSEQKFYLIIFALFKHPYVDKNSADHVDRLLRDMLDTATDEMIDFVLKNGFISFLKYCSDRRVEAIRWTFLEKMLSHASGNVKHLIVNHPIFLSFCVSSIETRQWYDCNQFIKLCFPATCQVMNFKKDFMLTNEIQSFCKKLIKENDMNELDDLLALYLVDSEAVLKYKKNLFPEEPSVSLKEFCVSELYNDRTGKLIEFINYFFPDSEVAADYRKELASEKKVIKLICEYINKGKFNKARDLVDQLLVRSEDFESVKTKLWTIYENIFKSGRCLQLRRVEWDKFLPWCSDSGKEVLRKLLPVDDIFLKILAKTVFVNQSVIKFNEELEFDELDCFLSCCFDTMSQINDYKINMINNHLRVEMISIMLKNPKKSASLKLIVEWFFGGNQQLIDDFKERYARDTSNLLFLE